jgi:hypothetical protein
MNSDDSDTVDIINLQCNKLEYEKVVLTQPTSRGGHDTYFTKLMYNDKSIYIQSPKCTSKGGVHSVGNKYYIDLLMSSDDNDFINFLESLEEVCITRIFEKKDAWFQTPPQNRSGIEGAFASPLKISKGGKIYILRAYLSQHKNLIEPSCVFFNENDEVITMDAIKQGSSLICILNMEGIRFSPKTFQFEINIKQLLVLANKPKECLIKKNFDAPLPAAAAAPPPLAPPPLKENLEHEPILKEYTVKEKDLGKTIKLNDKNDIHYRMYKDAKEKAKLAKQQAIDAYLIAEEIRAEYELEDLESNSESESSSSDSDDGDGDDFLSKNNLVELNEFMN